MPRKIDAQVKKAFAPIRIRLMTHFIIDIAVWGLIFAIGQGVIWMAVSFFIPITHIIIKMICTGSVIILASLVISWFIRPSILDMARKADRLGLQERMTTAYELSGLQDEFAKVQRQDTLEKLKSFNPRSIVMDLPKKRSWVAAGMAMVLIIGFMIPNPQHRIIKERLQVKKIIHEQFEKLEKDGSEKLSKEAGLTPEEREEIKKLLAELSTKLKKTNEYREAIKEISKAEEKLTEMIKEARQQKMAALGKELSKQEALKPLGEKVKEMDAEAIKQEMEKLQELAKSDNLDQEIMKALEGLEMELGEMSDNPLGHSEDLMYVLQDMKNKISQAGNQDIDKSQLAQGNQSGDQNAEGNNPRDDPGDNQGDSDQPGQGQGNQNGQGNSNQPGNGTSAGGNQGSGIGTAHPEYEKILDPKRLGDGGDISQVKGNANEHGSSQQVEAGQGLGTFDGFIPYNEVFGEYKSQAMQNIDRMNIPSNMREWVKVYFSSLD